MTDRRTFVKPLWNVRHDSAPERTTLGTESRARRYGTGRGYCVTADSPGEARYIVMRHQLAPHLPATDRVQIIDHAGVVVLMDAPRW